MLARRLHRFNLILSEACNFLFIIRRECVCADFSMELSETEANNNIVFEVEHIGDSSDPTALQVSVVKINWVALQ